MTRLATPLRQALRAALPQSWKVGDFVPVGTRVDRTTVSVWANALAHLPAAPAGYLLDLTVAILTPHQDPQRADDALDDAVQKVLAVLWTLPSVQVTAAERQATNDQTVHAWVITVQAGISITDTEA